MENSNFRDMERQANLEAGVEKEENHPADSGNAPIEDLTYSSIAYALANRYDSIYYVNVKNNHYVEYVSSSQYRDLKVERSGEDFFVDSRKNIRRVVHPDDVDFALMVHHKEYILAELEKEPVLSITYRLMFGDTPHYYNGRMTMAGPDDRDHLIIGWASVNSQILREKEFEETKTENRLTKNITKALTSDYVEVYYVDLEDNSYIGYTPDTLSEELMVSESGPDFFAETQSRARNFIYRKDLDRFSAAMYKENLMSLMGDAPFILTYRLLQEGRPVWHTLKALYADNKTHMLVAVRNIDVQKRQEAEYESKLHSMSILLNRDALTSVKNKNAFDQEESKWNQALSIGDEDVRFAVVVCDVNDLKVTNDTLGHKAGDELIIAAARLISDTFKRSPVFRIGGDEFVAVLKEHDYENRAALLEEIQRTVRENKSEGGVVIASGLASFETGTDSTFEDVFRRADAAMYENKRILKS